MVKMSAIELIRTLRRVLQSLAKFAAGEVVARFSMLLLYAFTTRRFGVAIFGYIALAQTVSAYVTLLGDQGFKLIGARMIARDQALIPYIIKVLVPRRVSFATVAALGGCAYAFWGPLPHAARGIVAALALAVIPASLALDWVLWGKGSYMALSGWKALVSITSSGLAIVGMVLMPHPLWSISIAYILAAIAGSVFLWLIVPASESVGTLIAVQELDCVRRDLRTRAVITLGMANLLNLVFTNSDLLLLAAMTNADEVGRYGSATRLLFVIFSTYYLLLNSLYPAIARVRNVRLLKNYLLIVVGLLFIGGAFSSALLAHFSHNILELLYGPSIHSAYLFRVLIMALPLELGTSLMGTVLSSQGREPILLRCLLAASAFNVTLNLIFIPRYHAIAAAWSTVASYVVLWLFCLGFVAMLRIEPPSRTTAINA